MTVLRGRTLWQPRSQINQQIWWIKQTCRKNAGRVRYSLFSRFDFQILSTGFWSLVHFLDFCGIGDRYSSLKEISFWQSLSSSYYRTAWYLFANNAKNLDAKPVGTETRLLLELRLFCTYTLACLKFFFVKLILVAYVHIVYTFVTSFLCYGQKITPHIMFLELRNEMCS